MELTLQPLLYLTSLILFFVLSLQFLQRKRVINSPPKSKLPPGPSTLPFIGSLHHLATAKFSPPTLRDFARRYGPVMLFRAGQIDILVLTSREAVQEVMKTQDGNFENRPILTATKALLYGPTDLAFSNGPRWRQLRRITLTELLSTKRVKSFSSIRHQEINCMLKSLCTFSDKSPVNLSAKLSELTSSVLVRAAFGGNCKGQSMFLEVLREVVELLPAFCLSDFFPSLSWLDVKMRRKLARIHRNLDVILEQTLQEHLMLQKERKNGEHEEIGYDLIDVLIKAREHGKSEIPLTLDSIKATILGTFIGGTDTTSMTTEWAMSELIKHPQIMAKAQAEVRQVLKENNKYDAIALHELPFLKLVIKETLRLHPPAPLLIPRICKETCQILGYTIPSGTRVVINEWAISRDPNYWEDADEFKPERFERCNIDFKGNNFEFLPFGGGRRICLGIEFGMAMVEGALGRLLLHFDWKVPDGVKPEDLDMTELDGSVGARKEPLRAIPILRVPLQDV